MAMSKRSRRRVGLGDALSPSEWTRVVGMLATIVGLFVVGFVLLFAAAPHHYHLSKTAVFGIGTGVLALTLGMRHAFDADHISAIDNTTRKLMAEMWSASKACRIPRVRARIPVPIPKTAVFER